MKTATEAELHGLYPALAGGLNWNPTNFAEKATVDSPLWGSQSVEEFLGKTREWLERYDALAAAGPTVTTPERVIHELLLDLVVEGERRELPVMLIADVEGEQVMSLRVYHSTWPLTGTHEIRPPILTYDLDQRPPEPVGSYHEALEQADADAADAQFEADGCVREPAGGPWIYCGKRRAQWYRDILSEGPIVLHLATITDDGETVVYEYMADRWGESPMPPQAGAAAYQRGRSGKLVSARIYDDVQPPASLGDV